MTTTIPEWATDIHVPRHEEDMTSATGPSRDINARMPDGVLRCRVTLDWDSDNGTCIRLAGDDGSVLMAAAQARQVADEIHQLLDIDQPRATATADNAPKDILTAVDVSQLLGIKVKTLANWRSAGKGPAYADVGGRARYRRHDVDTWLDTQTER